MLTLYYKTSCPFSLRVRIVLAEKTLPFSRRWVREGDPPAELMGYSGGKVPVLVDGSFAVTDSAVIVEYLEDAFPKPAMRPFDARGRAALRMEMRKIENELMAGIEELRDADEARERSRVLDPLEIWEGKVSESGLLLGVEFSLADVWLVAAVEKAAQLGLSVSPRFAKIRSWHARVSERASVRAERLAPEPLNHTAHT